MTDTAAVAAAKPNAKPLFPKILYNMLEDAAEEGFEDIVSWNKNGRYFKIHDRERFLSDILPRYARLTKYKSFVRQLNLWGFACIHGGRKSPDRGSYFHMYFVRGRDDLCDEIARSKARALEVAATTRKPRAPRSSNGRRVPRKPKSAVSSPIAFDSLPAPPPAAVGFSDGLQSVMPPPPPVQPGALARLEASFGSLNDIMESIAENGNMSSATDVPVANYNGYTDAPPAEVKHETATAFDFQANPDFASWDQLKLNFEESSNFSPDDFLEQELQYLEQAAAAPTEPAPIVPQPSPKRIQRHSRMFSSGQFSLPDDFMREVLGDVFWKLTRESSFGTNQEVMTF